MFVIFRKKKVLVAKKQDEIEGEQKQVHPAQWLLWDGVGLEIEVGIDKDECAAHLLVNGCMVFVGSLAVLASVVVKQAHYQQFVPKLMT